MVISGQGKMIFDEQKKFHLKVKLFTLDDTFYPKKTFVLTDKGFKKKNSPKNEGAEIFQIHIYPWSF